MFERLHGPARNSLGVAAIEVVRTELMVGRLVGKQMIGGHEQGMRDGDDGFLVFRGAA